MNEDCLEVASLKNKNAVNYYDSCRTGNAPQLHHFIEFEERELENIDSMDDESVIGLEAYPILVEEDHEVMKTIDPAQPVQEQDPSRFTPLSILIAIKTTAKGTL